MSGVAIWAEVDGATGVPRTHACVVTIGNFDGVHRGHRLVLEHTREDAHRRGIATVAVTFHPHPLEVIAPAHAPKRLTSIERRIELLREAGADEVYVLDFDREMASWSPEEFVTRVVVDQLHAANVVVGDNFRFGHKAQGDVAYLREAGERLGFAVDDRSLLGDGEAFSSTRVRELVAERRLDEAAEVLGRPVEVTGTIVGGDRRGRELGFPTANVPVDEAYAVPPDGVYAGWLVRASGERLPAAISVGSNPTFDGTERRVESYVLDRDDLDLYGEHVRVELVAPVREMERFDGVEALVARMHDDVARTRALLAL